MRRLLAILLLAAFGLPTVAPLLAQGQDIESNLPACCRRNGDHHCTTMGMARDSNSPTLSARCPSFPQPPAIVAGLKFAALLTAQLEIEFPATTQSAFARAENQRRISRERSHHPRGPPAALLAA